MEVYAREGLRTLLVTCSDLDGDWFLAWDKRCGRRCRVALVVVVVVVVMAVFHRHPHSLVPS